MSRLKKVIEYGVRTIDEHGDVIDVDHYSRLPQAKLAALRAQLGERVCAVVIEREVKYGNEEEGLVGDIDFTTVYRHGSATALHAGGWDHDE